MRTGIRVGAVALALVGAEPAAAAWPLHPGQIVTVHSGGRTLTPATHDYRWCDPGSECSATVLDYAACQPPSCGSPNLPLRAGASVVVRTRLRARAVTLRLYDGDSRAIGPAHGAASLGSPGRVWRMRLPGGIARARDLGLTIDYRYSADGRELGGVFSMGVWVCGKGRGCRSAEFPVVP